MTLHNSLYTPWPVSQIPSQQLDHALHPRFPGSWPASKSSETCYLGSVANVFFSNFLFSSAQLASGQSPIWDNWITLYTTGQVPRVPDSQVPSQQLDHPMHSWQGSQLPGQQLDNLIHAWADSQLPRFPDSNWITLCTPGQISRFPASTRSPYTPLARFPGSQPATRSPCTPWPGS